MLRSPTVSHRACTRSSFSARRPSVHANSRVQRSTNVTVRASVVEPGSLVLVAGSTGGVGQLVTAKLLERGYKVRALVRNKRKAEMIFGPNDGLEVVECDARVASAVAAIMEGVDAVVCSTGTTALPSTRWEGGNGPRPTDWVASSNIINATPKSAKRFVFVTSAGVTRSTGFPWAILNTFGVLRYKRDSEKLLENSGIPFTVLRPSRLTDGPYTSFDLNTVLKATSGQRQAVTLSGNDDLAGEASRIAVAEAAVQALQLPGTAGKLYALSSMEGEGPGKSIEEWSKLFASIN